MVKAYSLLKYIYPGPHLDQKTGKLDERVYFHIPVSVDPLSKEYTYIVFPYGADPSEITELVV